MGIVVLSLAAGILASLITTKIIAINYFKKIDGYVYGSLDRIKEIVAETIKDTRQ